jgi:hypothetical protein
MVNVGVFAPYQPEPEKRPVSAETVHIREGDPADVPACLDLVERVLKLDRAPWERSLMESVTDPARMLHVAENAGRIAGYARATHWTRPPNAPTNAAPSGPPAHDFGTFAVGSVRPTRPRPGGFTPGREVAVLVVPPCHSLCHD